MNFGLQYYWNTSVKQSREQLHRSADCGHSKGNGTFHIYRVRLDRWSHYNRLCKTSIFRNLPPQIWDSNKPEIASLNDRAKHHIQALFLCTGSELQMGRDI